MDQKKRLIEMKKICFFYNSLNMSGGVERVVTNLINNLHPYYDITILVKDDGKCFYPLEKNVQIKSINCFLNFDMDHKYKRIINVLRNTGTSIHKLRKHFRNNNYDYVYTATPLDSFQAYFSLQDKSKLIVSEHASRDAYNYIYKRMRSYVYRRVQTVSVPTTLDTARYKNDGYKSVYVPHLTTYSTNLCQSKKRKIVLNVGRLTEDKQQILLLKIWKNVLTKRGISGWILLIIGEGELKNEINASIQTMGLQDSVKLLNATSHIEKYYEKASIFSFTSRMEGYGMVLTEAMSYGLPCISFDCPSGPRDIITDSEDGYLISCFDIEEYSNKLYDLMLNDNKRLSFSKNALKKIENWDNIGIIEKWKDIFK